MSDGSLSQDEIDALLQGTDDSSFDLGGMEETGADDGVLSQVELKSLLDLINFATTNVGDALGAMVEKKITITNPKIEVIKSASLQNQLHDEVVEVKMDFEDGVVGEHYYIVEKETAEAISGLMMGQSGNELTEASLSAVSEAMNVICGTASNKIGSKSDKSLKPSAPVTGLKNKTGLSLNPQSDYVKIQYDFMIEGYPSSVFIELYALNIIKDILSAIMPATNSAAGKQAAPQMQQQQMPQMMGGGNMMNPQMMGGNMMNPQMMGGNMMNPQMMGGNMMNPQMMGGNMMNPQMMGGNMMNPYQQVPVQGVQFADLNNISSDGQGNNINLLLDVNMELTVELGRTKKSIKDILGMGEGTVIELDKLAGEPVDVLVNGQLIAKGEVVVIDENFGVRVTEIINPMDRLRDLG